MVEKEEAVVKWLYPGADEDQPSVSDMESELQTDKSFNGSEASSPTTSGPEVSLSSEASAAATPDSAPPTITELGNKMTAASTAASTYMGSLLASSWYSGAPKATPAELAAETADGKMAAGDGEVSQEKPAAASGISSFSSAFFNTIGKVSGQSKESTAETEKDKEDGKEKGEAEENKEEKEASSGFGYFSSALSAGFSGLSSSISSDFLGDKKAEGNEEGEKPEENEGDFFSSAFSTAASTYTKVGQAASTYTKVIQDTVSKAPMLAEFNQEQTNFIKSKGETDIPVAPWSGYLKEEELKEKIINLSLDQRNFLRAPPSGVEFDMENDAVRTHAVVLLKEDPRLEKIRYELVPKQIKEAEFWRNYFYRVGVLQQSYELDMATVKKETKKAVSAKVVEEEGEGVAPSTQDHDDEFVSDSHQVSSKDLAEADEAMKKLGLDKNEAEWEAELEGELEYEMVQGENADMDNPEWEEQIQELLDAESKEPK